LQAEFSMPTKHSAQDTELGGHGVGVGLVGFGTSSFEKGASGFSADTIMFAVGRVGTGATGIIVGALGFRMGC
jgi:hypothetical protein